VSKYELQLAGWIAAVSAALTIPLFAFQAVAAQAGLTWLSSGIQLVNVLLFLYVLSCLRAFLAQKHFDRANAYLAAIIGITLCVQCMALFVSELPELSLPMLAGLVVRGVLYLVVGIKLLGEYSVRAVSAAGVDGHGHRAGDPVFQGSYGYGESVSRQFERMSAAE
jgi:uncharacterized membrane protein HdeD (DUF308 family)